MKYFTYVINHEHALHLEVDKLFDRYMYKDDKSLSVIQSAIRKNNLCKGSSGLLSILSNYKNYVIVYEDDKICAAGAIEFIFKSDQEIYDFDENES